MLAMLFLLLLALAAPPAALADSVALADPPATPAMPPPPAQVVALLRDLPYPGPEARLRWEWDPTAFEPLTHPVARDFPWRFRQLRQAGTARPVQARLNLDLAFLDAASPRASLGRVDSLGAEARAREARRLYGLLLAENPGQPEYLTDLGDLYRFVGRPDSALVVYRQAATADRPPARLFSRLASAELEALEGAPDSLAVARFQEVRRAGLRFFAGPEPEAPARAARFALSLALFRIDMNVLESYADRRLHPDRWKAAGVDSLFTLLARVVSPETRKIAARAAELDSNLAEAHGLMGCLGTGQVLLPIAARGELYRRQEIPADTLALALWTLGRERYDERAAEVAAAATHLNRCETLEPGRFPVVHLEGARLSFLAGDLDQAAGLWRAVLTRSPDRADCVDDLYTVYRVEAGLRKSAVAEKDAAIRLQAALEPIVAKTGSAALLAHLAWARAAQGNAEAAHADYVRAVEVDSAGWRGHLGLAVEALRRLDSPAAEPHLQAVGRHFSEADGIGQGIYCGAVGLLFWARGNTLDARRWLEESRQFDPRNGVTARALQLIAGRRKGD